MRQTGIFGLAVVNFPKADPLRGILRRLGIFAVQTVPRARSKVSARLKRQ
jgi:hypothetical protein